MSNKITISPKMIDRVALALEVVRERSFTDCCLEVHDEAGERIKIISYFIGGRSRLQICLNSTHPDIAGLKVWQDYTNEPSFRMLCLLSQLEEVVERLSQWVPDVEDKYLSGLEQSGISCTI